jgi:hypothetical protein
VPPPLDFANSIDWAEQVVLLYRRMLPDPPAVVHRRDEASVAARVRVWPAVVDGEVFVRNPRGTRDDWSHGLSPSQSVIAVADGLRIRARTEGSWWTAEPEIVDAVNRAFAERYAGNPAFAKRITAPQCRAATLCLRGRADDRPPPWFTPETWQNLLELEAARSRPRLLARLRDRWGSGERPRDGAD